MFYGARESKTWNAFLLRQPTQMGLFLQSNEWLAFQEALGRKVWRLEVRDESINKEAPLPTGICAIIKHQLPTGKSYFYSPRGPVLNFNTSTDRYRDFFIFLKDQIKKETAAEKIIFWRFEPFSNLAFSFYESRRYGRAELVELTALHTRRGRHLIADARRTKPIQPKRTLIINLSLAENKLLSSMREKTRYNIRLAERKSVKVENVECEIESIKLFFKLLSETAKRDQFKPHLKSYYEKMLELLGKQKSGREQELKNDACQFHVKLWFAIYKNEPIAGAIIGYFGDTATYLHGASSYQHRALMAPYLLHWETMRHAKEKGYKWYDFWGIDEKKWPGLTRFKKGFNGIELNYSGTFDLIFSHFWYNLYRLGRRIF